MALQIEYLHTMNGMAVCKIIVLRPRKSMRGPPMIPPNKAAKGIMPPIQLTACSLTGKYWLSRFFIETLAGLVYPLTKPMIMEPRDTEMAATTWKEVKRIVNALQGVF